jgi:hypothetical protein
MHIDVDLASASPVDVLHCVFLGLVQQELRLYCAQLSESRYRAFRNAWQKEAKLPQLSDNKQTLFRNGVTGKQLVSQFAQASEYIHN